MKRSSIFIFILYLTLQACNNSNSEEEVSEESHETDTIENTFEIGLDDDTYMDTAPLEENIDRIEVLEKEETLPASEKTDEPVEINSQIDEVKEVESFIRKEGMSVPQNYKMNLATFAAEDIVLLREGDCGENCGRQIIIANYNAEKAIEVVVQANWKIEKEKFRKTQLFVLHKEQDLTIGCASSCTEDPYGIKWKIMSAKYVN